MSNFDINVDRRTDEQTDKGKSGRLCRIREMFHARFGGFFSLVIDKYTNFDINVELRHKC